MAGWRGGDLFDAGALKLLAQNSEGRTRKLNMLADKSMLAAFAEGVGQVGVDQVRRAAGDSLPSGRRAAPAAGYPGMRYISIWRKFAPLALGVLAAVGVGYGLGYGSGRVKDGQAPVILSNAMADRQKAQVALAPVQALAVASLAATGGRDW